MYLRQTLYREAKELYREVDRDCVEFTKQYENNAIFFVLSARCSSYLADIANNEHDDTLGMELSAKELETHRALSAGIDAPETRREVAVSLGHMTVQCLIGKDYAAAEEYIREAITISTELAELGEENSLKDLASHYGLYADVCKGEGRIDESLEYRNKALSIEEKLYAEDDSDVLATNLSIGYEKFADLYYELGDIKESCEYLRKDYEICRKLHEKLCTAETLENLIGCYQRLARNALDSENYEDIRQDVEEACVSLKGLLRNSDSFNAKIIVADVFNQFGEFYSGFDRPDKAKENYLAAIYICQMIGDEDTSGKAEAKMVTALNGIRMINEASE